MCSSSDDVKSYDLMLSWECRVSDGLLDNLSYPVGKIAEKAVCRGVFLTRIQTLSNYLLK